MALGVSFDDMWKYLPQWFDAEGIPPGEKHPKEKVFRQIPGMKIPAGWETCCVQMSYALARSGHKVSYSNKSRVLRDGFGNEYLLDVAEMRGYLNGFQDAEKIERPARIPRWLVQAVLSGRKGILAFGGRHIDLWNGSRIHGESYIESALWEAASTIKNGLFFWELS